MTPEREKLIRDVWEARKDGICAHFHTGSFRVNAVPTREFRPSEAAEPKPMDVTDVVETLTFRVESKLGVPWHRSPQRVTCEGLVLEHFAAGTFRR